MTAPPRVLHAVPTHLGAAAEGQPPDPTARTDQLRQHHVDQLVGGLSASRFTRITDLANTVFDVPMSAVTLGAEPGTFHRSTDEARLTQLAATDAFWQHTVDSAAPLLVPDATADRRFHRSPVVTGNPFLRFYGGVPLFDHDGVVLGAFGIYDTAPRRLDRSQWTTFVELAGWVRKELLDSEEMTHARLVQQSLLPRCAPSLPGYEVAGICLPTRSVGGDFYDFAQVAGRTVFCLVDVMGKGAGAALVAATVRALLRATVSEVALGVGNRRPGNEWLPIRGGMGGVVADIARLVFDDLDRTGTLVTGFFCDLDPRSGVLQFSDAGHGLTVLVRTDGSATWLRAADLPIGVEPVGSWSQDETVLNPGDTVLSVSDGLLDLFGGIDEALVEIAGLVRRHPHAEELVDVISELTRGGTAVDDVTAVAVHRVSA